MKKKTILLPVLVVALILGITLTIIGIIMGGALHNFYIGSDKDTSENTNKTIELSDTDIQKLDFDLSAHSVVLRNGDTFSVSGGEIKKNTTENNIWKLETESINHTINVFGFSLHLPFFHLDRDTLVITIPKDTTFEEINLNLSAGDVKIATINASTAKLKVSAGDIECDNMLAKNATLSVSAGDIDISKFNVTEEASVTCNAGNINLGTEEAFENNLFNNLDLDCSMGDIDIYGKLTGENSLKCSMGDINAELVGPRSNYNIISSSATMGDISYEKEENESTSSETTTSPSATLKLKCTMGDIDISYND